MWLVKTDDNAIAAHCPLCLNEEAFSHNWQETEWADGMMEPMPATSTRRLIDLVRDMWRSPSLLGAGRDRSLAPAEIDS
jgi:hypothetical protein